MEDYKETGICVLCGKGYNRYGNNPYPVSEEGRCCDYCNDTKVIPARLNEVFSRDNKDRVD